MDKKRKTPKVMTEIEVIDADGSKRTTRASVPQVFIVNQNLKREFIQQAAIHSAARRHTSVY